MKGNIISKKKSCRWKSVAENKVQSPVPGARRSVHQSMTHLLRTRDENYKNIMKYIAHPCRWGKDYCCYKSIQVINTNQVISY